MATDGTSSSETASVTITVLDENNAPVAKSKSYRTLVNQSIDVELSGSDEDEDLFEFEITELPDHGDLSGEGVVRVYAPHEDYLGNDVIRYLAFDGQDVGPGARISITITDINTAPEVQSLSFTGRMNTAQDITLTGTDGEGTRLKFIITHSPLHGTLEGESPAYVYVPNEDYIGGDRIRFFADDGELQSDTASAYIRVKFPNDPPIASDFEMDVLPNAAGSVSLRVFDPDGDAIQTAILKGPQNGKLFGLGLDYTYTPDTQFEGSDSFTFMAWDGYQYSDEARITLNVTKWTDGSKLRIASISTSDSGITLGIAAEGVERIVIQESADLEGWSDVREIDLEGGEAEATLEVNDEQTKQFYRVMSLP